MKALILATVIALSPALASAERQVVFLGSSTTAGTGASSPEKAYARMLGYDITNADPAIVVMNLASPGSTTRHWTNWIYSVLDTNNLGTDDAVIFSIGNNDQVNGYATSEITNNWKLIYSACTNAGVPFWCTTIMPLEGYFCATVEPYKDFITDYFGNRCIDFWDGGGVGLVDPVDCTQNPTYALGDGTHFNDAGHDWMYDQWTNSPFLQWLHQKVDITDYGAVGDASRFYVFTTNGAAVVTTTNTWSGADVGKVLQVFGVRAGSWGFITNNQDVLAIVTNVVNGTNLWFDRNLPTVTTNALAIFGRNNATNLVNAFTEAHALFALGEITNVTMWIPAGTYLAVDPDTTLNGSWVPDNYADHDPIVSIYSGGFTVAGEGTNSVLMGVGAAVSRLDAGATPNFFRGTLFWIGDSSFSNSAWPIVFRDHVMDGGVPAADRFNNSQKTTHWDVTHDAVILYGAPAQFCNLTMFTNMVFQHWCGEMVKNIMAQGGTNVLNVFEDCTFHDGSGSAMATTHAHEIRNCVFTELRLWDEWYQSYATLPSVIEFNTASNVGNIAIVGAVTNVQPQPTMLIRSNYMHGSSVAFGNGQNVTVHGNVFTNGLLYVVFNGNSQPGNGTDAPNSNIVFTANTFHNDPLISGGPSVYLTGATITGLRFENNTGLSASIAGGPLEGEWPADHDGGAKTNVVFVSNTGSKLMFVSPGVYSSLDSRNAATGSYFVDYGDVFATYADSTGKTNVLTYGIGRLHNPITAQVGSRWYLDATEASLIPSGSTAIVSNSTGGTITIYRTSTLTSSMAEVVDDAAQTFYWWNNQWNTNQQGSVIQGNVSVAGSLRIGL